MITKKNLERVKEIIETLQKELPSKAVTKNRIFGVIMEKYRNRLQKYNVRKKLGELKSEEKKPKPEMSYRTIERALRELVKKRSLIRDGHGQYWLPEYYDDFTRKKKALSFFWDALKYCDSDEDWKLLDAFFDKMRENLKERAMVENEEAIARFLDEDWKLLDAFFDKMRENLKERAMVENEEAIARFLDEDWKLLDAFFDKMRENLKERAMVENEEAIARFLEEMEKK